MRYLHAARVNYQGSATVTITGTTGKAGPKGLGVYRTGVADHLAVTSFGSLGGLY